MMNIVIKTEERQVVLKDVEKVETQERVNWFVVQFRALSTWAKRSYYYSSEKQTFMAELESGRHQRFFL